MTSNSFIIDRPEGGCLEVSFEFDTVTIGASDYVEWGFCSLKKDEVKELISRLQWFVEQVEAREHDE